MQSFLLSSSVLVGLVSARYALVPSSSYVDVTSVAGTIESDRVSALLSIPFEDESETLDIVLDIGSADRECLDSNLYLNGESVVLAAPGVERFQFSVPHYTGDQPPMFEAAGSLTCLRGEASLVDLRIYSAEQPETAIAAVVFSYKQAGQPVLNRLLYGSPEALALHLTTLSIDLPTWTNPVDDVKVTITAVKGYTDSDSNLPNGLEAQLLRLDLLKHHAADIQKEIKATEAKIMSLWKSEFSKCNSIGCYLKTAVAKAPTLAHLLASHLSHHNHIDIDFFRNSTHMNCTMEVEKVVEQHEKQMVLVNLAEEAESEEEVGVADKPSEVAEDNVDDSPSADIPSEDTSNNEESDDTSSWNGRHPPWRHGAPGRGGRPPWAKPGSRPPWAKGDKPAFGRPPWARPGGHPPWRATEENHTPAATGPSTSEESNHKGDTTYRLWPFSLTPQDRFKIAAFFIAAIVVGISVLTLACAICIRRKCMFLRDPRRKADCAARREERRTRALYRKAACKYRMRTFFQRFRLPRPFASSDYEEKCVLLTTDQDSESSTAGGIIGPQIDRLRTFHEFLFREVSRRAELGAAAAARRRQRPGEQTPAELDAPERSSVRSETLPAYSLPPPSYRNGGLGSEISVVTGFTGYTPSGSGETADADADVDDITESSIVDCSPRLSFESQRTGGTRGRE